MIRGGLALALAVAPATAEACAACLSTAYGDRSFNWAFLGLIAMPFLVATTVGGVLVWSSGLRPFGRRSSAGPRATKETP